GCAKGWRRQSREPQLAGEGRVSATEIVSAALRRISERDKILNAFTAVTDERARAKARAIDAERAAGRPLGALAGVPFAVKNLFDVAGTPPPPARHHKRDTGRAPPPPRPS